MAAKTRSPIPPAREAALEALYLTLGLSRSGQGRDAQAALDEVLRKRSLSPQDKGLCTELFYGYLRLSGRMDFILSTRLKKPGGLPPQARIILGAAVYEILNLDGVPTRASVNWAVEEIGRAFGKGLSGLANAVLRRIAENVPAYDTPDFYRSGGVSQTTYLSRYYSCPEWLVALWLDAYGEKRCEAYLAAQINTPPSGLRVNFTKPEASELFERLKGAPECVFAAEPMLAFTRFPEWFDASSSEKSGLVSRQSAAAGHALAFFEPESWPEPIYDACCGRGGKTLHLLEKTGARVLASDPHSGRLKALGAESRRLGLSLFARFMADAAHPPIGSGPLAPKTILLDAPCSGLGVLSRRPDSKHKRTREQLDELVLLQRNMLDACYTALPSGGLLVYLTCTLNPAENEDQIAAFLEKTPGANLQKTLETSETDGLFEFFYGVSIRKS